MYLDISDIWVYKLVHISCYPSAYITAWKMFLVPSSDLCGTYHVYITISLYIILLYLIFGHDITGILLKVALSTIIETLWFSVLCCIDFTSFYDFCFWFLNCSDSVEFSFYSLTISLKSMNWYDRFISGCHVWVALWQ